MEVKAKESDRGVIVENMSTHKLAWLSFILLICQVVSFLVGAVVSPAPNTSMSYLATKCVDTTGDVLSSEMFYPRGEGRCARIDTFDSPEAQEFGLTAEHIVFAFQMPHPRDGIQMDFSRWQQQLMAILLLDIEYEESDAGTEYAADSNNNKDVAEAAAEEKDIALYIQARLAYRDKSDDEDAWTVLDSAAISRTMSCSIEGTMRKSGYYYNCSMVNLFELGSLHHDYYLLNIRLPSMDHGESVTIKADGSSHVTVHPRPVNEDIGKLIDVNLITIVQNGGFTKVWVAIKTFFFPFVAVELAWFVKRVTALQRSRWSPIEMAICGLASSLVLLDVPFEFLTLHFNMPWLPLFNDVKQGLFYGMLMIFWVVFVGEHGINEGNETVAIRAAAASANSSSSCVAHAKKLALVCFGCCCLFVFDVCDKGIQLANIFHSLWATEFGSRFAVTFIVMAAVSAAAFFMTLCVMIYRVFVNISAKRAAISSMNRVRRLHYEGLIWRFRFLMVATLVTAAMTTATFILGQVQANDSFDYEHHISLQYTSGFLTGVYGMWNVYVFGVLFLYAPSHRYKDGKSVLTQSQSTMALNDAADASASVAGSSDDATVVAATEASRRLYHRAARGHLNVPSSNDCVVSGDTTSDGATDAAVTDPDNTWTELSVLPDLLKQKTATD